MCRHVAFSIGMLLLVAGSAAGQDEPAVDVSGGYALFRFAGDTMPLGWYGAGSIDVTRRLAIGVDVSGTYRTETLDTTEPPGAAPFRLHSVVHARLHGLVTGPRVTATWRHVRPFAQFLVGTVRISSTASITINGNVSRELSDALSRAVFRFAIQPGAGVDIPIRDRVGARVAVGYRRIALASEEVNDVNELRIAAGIVLVVRRR